MSAESGVSLVAGDEPEEVGGGHVQALAAEEGGDVLAVAFEELAGVGVVNRHRLASWSCSTWGRR